jgi:hypothetical protein
VRNAVVAPSAKFELLAQCAAEGLGGIDAHIQHYERHIMTICKLFFAVYDKQFLEFMKTVTRQARSSTVISIFLLKVQNNCSYWQKPS